MFADCESSDLLRVFEEARLSEDVVVAEAQRFLSPLRTKPLVRVDVVKIETAWVDREGGWI